MKHSSIILHLVTLLTCSFACADQPNIVFILTDDQGYGDLGCTGAEGFKTPNIDQLAAEGMFFESFYVHNRCSPTRAALMTGTIAHRIGASKVIYRHDKIGIHPDEITLPELLKKAGYTTGMVGKWHLGEWDEFHPMNHGFDSFYGFRYENDRVKAIFDGNNRVETIKNQTDGKYFPMLLEAGKKFIQTNKDQPFFLYYASPLPHTKWIPNERFAGSSDHGDYGDVIQEIDWQVGELLETLETLGIADNTLVVYTSDNGPQLNVDGHGSAGPFRDGKWTDFEGGIRVPCIMLWPGKIPSGTRNNEITSIVDVLPTCCDITDLDVPSDRKLDGKSILPYMLGKVTQSPVHDRFIIPGSTVRHGDWKLFTKPQKPGGKFKPGVGMPGRKPVDAGAIFNLENDPGETVELATQHPEKVQELERMMAVFQEELKATSREIGKAAEWSENFGQSKADKESRRR